MQEYVAKQRALDARPIKKLAEAKFRKKKRVPKDLLFISFILRMVFVCTSCTNYKMLCCNHSTVEIISVCFHTKATMMCDWCCNVGYKCIVIMQVRCSSCLFYFLSLLRFCEGYVLFGKIEVEMQQISSAI